METFGYNKDILYNKEIDIEDIGNICLEAIDTKGFNYYLIIKTKLGESSCLEYGPIAIDCDMLPQNTEIKFQRVDFNEKLIKSIINKFLSTKGKGKFKSEIENVNEIDFEKALSLGVNLFDYMKGFSEETNY